MNARLCFVNPRRPGDMLAFDVNGEGGLIVLLNGAFGIGKTTVARALVPRLPRCVLFDPEPIGILLQRLARAAGRNVDDFQDLRLWRRLTIAALRLLRLFSPNIVVPMAFSNPAYLEEIRTALRRFEPTLHHFCLIAPLAVVHNRQSKRRPRGPTRPGNSGAPPNAAPSTPSRNSPSTSTPANAPSRRSPRKSWPRSISGYSQLQSQTPCGFCSGL